MFNKILFTCALSMFFVHAAFASGFDDGNLNVGFSELKTGSTSKDENDIKKNSAKIAKKVKFSDKKKVYKTINGEVIFETVDITESLEELVEYEISRFKTDLKTKEQHCETILNNIMQNQLNEIEKLGALLALNCSETVMFNALNTNYDPPINHAAKEEKAIDVNNEAYRLLREYEKLDINDPYREIASYYNNLFYDKHPDYYDDYDYDYDDYDKHPDYDYLY